MNWLHNYKYYTACEADHGVCYFQAATEKELKDLISKHKSLLKGKQFDLCEVSVVQTVNKIGTHNG